MCFRPWKNAFAPAAAISNGSTLRLGVANASLEEGQQRELHVLKVCLAEVKRCRPFLIVLLGDRYGWVPPVERIEAAAREEGFEGNCWPQRDRP